MKRILLFSALLATVSFSFAQWQNKKGNGPDFDNRNDKNYRSSAVVIKAFTEKRFTVMIDNVQYQLNSNYNNGRRDNFINIGAINPGKHSITVYETRSGFFGKTKQKVVYNSYTFFKPGMETVLSVNDYGDVAFSERRMYGYEKNDWKKKDKHRGHDRDDDNRW